MSGRERGRKPGRIAYRCMSGADDHQTTNSSLVGPGGQSAALLCERQRGLGRAL